MDGMVTEGREKGLLAKIGSNVLVLAAKAGVTACRLQAGMAVRRLMSLEVASSTECQTRGSGACPFDPKVFVDIYVELDTRLKALGAFEQEMRPWPHSRSAEAVEDRNRWLGALVRIEAADGFVRRRRLL